MVRGGFAPIVFPTEKLLLCLTSVNRPELRPESILHFRGEEGVEEYR